MIYLKSVFVGLAAALAASVAWILAMLVLPIALPFLISRFAGVGAVGAGASVGSGSILAVALVGFVAGFYWCLRRASTQGNQFTRR